MAAFVSAPSLRVSFREYASRNLRRRVAFPRASAAPAGRVRFPALRADRFRHPIDVNATRTLRRFLGVEQLLRAVLIAVEQTLFFENIATGVQVSPTQLPHIHQSLVNACEVLDMQVPELFVRQNPVPNAYTLAIQGKKSFIVLHSSLVELLTERELQSVLAHELGHLKCEHGVWVTLANMLMLISTSMFGGQFGRALYEVLNRQLLRWQRAAELTCDRAALLVMQDPRIVMSALMKLTGGSPKYADELDLDSFLKQAERFDEASKSSFGRVVRDTIISGTTHPLPIFRVRELQKWAQSNHFQSIVQSGKPFIEGQVGKEKKAGSAALEVKR